MRDTSPAVSSFSPYLAAMAVDSSTRLRILIVVEPGVDGVFRHVEGLVQFLIDQGQEVHLAYSTRRGSPELRALVKRVEDSGFEALDLRISNAPDVRDVRALYRLLGLVRRIRPGVIHSHSSKAGVLGRTLALMGVKGAQFYTPHAYYGMAARPGLKNVFYNGIEGYLAFIGRTIHISDDERDFAVQTLRFPAARSLLIRNAINTDFFVPPSTEQKQQRREELQLPKHGIILGAMGRLSFQKDCKSLYMAFALARQQGCDCHLLHVGRGEDQTELEKMARTLNIEMHISRISYLREPLKFYQAIDGLILTSRYEGCPLVALEALSCDLPLLLSEAPGVSWLGRSDLSHCWMSPVGEPTAFAQAISQWLEDRPRSRPSNHRDFATQHFTLEKLYGEILSAYRAAAENDEKP